MSSPHSSDPDAVESILEHVIEGFASPHEVAWAMEMLIATKIVVACIEHPEWAMGIYRMIHPGSLAMLSEEACKWIEDNPVESMMEGEP